MMTQQASGRRWGAGWRRGLALAVGLALGGLCPARAVSPAEAQAAADQAIDYFRAHCANRGGALWWYSTDLTTQAGEGRPCPASQIWIQYPGTPAVGEVYLKLYEATGDAKYLDYATETGEALAWGQLASGGWDYMIDFDEENSKNWYYRRDVDAGDTERGKRRNTSTVDDDNTQEALRFLIRLDQALKGENASIHHCLEYGLNGLIAAQYPVGAWPQRFDGPADPATPVLNAHYPDDWPKTYPKVNYASFYTLNDNTLRDCITTLFQAFDAYGDTRYEQAALNGGEFLLRAQMPEPQPTWAQQYNHNMEPAWARKFEPASVTGGESVGAMQLLVDLWIRTGDTKWIEPLPRAIEWFRRSRLPDGKMARFYEFHTNKPLFFVRNTYEMTYSDADMPTHYSFKVDTFPQVERIAETITQDRETLYAARHRTLTARDYAAQVKTLEPQVEKAIAALDAEHRWTRHARITEAAEVLVARDIISTQDYLRNLQNIAKFITASRLQGE